MKNPAIPSTVHSMYGTSMLRVLILCIPCLVLAMTVDAQIRPTREFHGPFQESWEWLPTRNLYSNNMVTPPMAIMRGNAVISGGRLVVYQPGRNYPWWHLGSLVMAGAAHGKKGVGVETDANHEREPSTVTIEFTRPVSSFGGYWATALPARLNSITFSFYDGSGGLIGTDTVTYSNFRGALEWRGWHSTVPIKRMTYTGFGVAADYLQASPVGHIRRWRPIMNPRSAGLPVKRREGKTDRGPCPVL
jgi:hypothetical protein